MGERATDDRSSGIDLSPAGRSAGLGTRADPLLVANLLGDLNAIADLLAREIERESWLNAFLLAAGLNQIAEDYLHENSISLARVARHLQRVAPRPLGTIAAAAIRTTDVVAWTARTLPRSERRAAAWQRRAGALVDGLADAVVTQPSSAAQRRLAETSAALLEDRLRLPVRLRRSIVRLPSCFRNFDQQPADLGRLTDEFSLRWPDRARNLALVGVRTSGSYTAPLHSAYLRALGYENVRVLTVRPGQRWRRHATAAVTAVARSGGLALVSDDPPKSGGSVARTALELEGAGFSPQSIVLLLQTLAGTARLPERLTRYPSVVLPWHQWSVQARLDSKAVHQTLAEMLAPATEVLAVEPTDPMRAPRGHLQARYRVQLRDRTRGHSYEREIHVKGVGLGYFGEHALAVAQPLQAFLPEVLGVRDGLLYRQWLAPESRVGEVEPDRATTVAGAVVDYAVNRARALPVAEDVSLRLGDRGAVWQRAGDILTRAFGPAGQLVRPVSHPLVKGLLRVGKPSVIDGSMDIDKWFARGPGAAPQKVDFDERAFSSLDVYCNDHVFDVAGWAPGTSDEALPAALRNIYRQRTGRTIDPERWLLYRLVHVAERHRDEPNENVETERAMAREMQQYYRDTVFADLTADPTGPLCAFDVDWVLETRSLGFPGITPAAAVALRALARHGYRVAIATGRSVSEVRERCRSYRLVGGVAEYGAAVYDARTERVRDLLSPEDRERLDSVRRTLSETEGLVVDGDYTSAVRAYRFDDVGRRRGLRLETIKSVLDATALQDRVRSIRGWYQTDFMVNTVDKAFGMRALAGDLGVETDRGALLALAVGDSAEDLPLMKLARQAMAPANADSTVQAAGIRILSKPHQLGVAQAVAELIGHAPGACSRCELTQLSARSRLLVTALAAQDARRLGKVLHLFRLAGSLARTAL
jgi:hydroxymethylpyrimidine pyrophosphatase-like HAD family hydrolase